MAAGYWVVRINRDTGEASTEPLIDDRDEAYQRSLDLETTETATTVVPRRTASRGECTP